MIWPLTGLPHRTYLSLASYQLRDNEVEAMKIWDTISGMRGLKELKIELNVAGLWRKSWVGWEEVLLECFAEAGGFGRDDAVVDNQDIPNATSGRLNIQATPAESGDEEDRVLTLWLPWEKNDVASASNMRKSVWEERLGCKIIWK